MAAARYLQRLRNPAYRSPCSRIFSTKINDPKLHSHIEIERKFLPTPKLMQCLQLPGHDEAESNNVKMGGANELEHDEMRRDAAEAYGRLLERFMRAHEDLFSTDPKPVGKLSAYLEWKKKHANHDS